MSRYDDILECCTLDRLAESIERGEQPNYRHLGIEIEMRVMFPDAQLLHHRTKVDDPNPEERIRAMAQMFINTIRRAKGQPDITLVAFTADDEEPTGEHTGNVLPFPGTILCGDDHEDPA